MSLRQIPFLLCAAIVLLEARAAPESASRTPNAVTFDGGRYYGPIVNGKLAGEGVLEWDDGSRYDGVFKDGLMTGKGRRQDSAGRLFEGWFEAGALHGKGRVRTPEGDIYEGEFRKNKLTGHGVYTRADGMRYEGQFLDWRFHGEGRYWDASGFLQEGSFQHGEFTGRGRMQSDEGWRYEGEVKEGRPHGKGVLHLANGDVYNGHFADGLYEGEGTLIHATPMSDGRVEERGRWRNGKLDDPQRELQSRLNVESALYTQRVLLDRAIDTLKLRDPNRINLYLLAVGGDGRQEVFRREVDFVSEQFVRHYGAQGHALALVNSRSTVSSRPMATITSIREALEAMAARMDTQEDILFLFISSHGSSKHEIALGHEAMRVRDLPAEDLGRMLKASGIRWKVVVVSACYAGGVIDHLKDDSTLIITAARHDRRSFGCADDSEFTYFGRAFFKEALPVSRSFEDAFERAEKLVQEWERKEIQTKPRLAQEALSLPQIVMPTPMRAYLRKWWAQQNLDHRKLSDLGK